MSRLVFDWTLWLVACRFVILLLQVPAMLTAVPEQGLQISFTGEPCCVHSTLVILLLTQPCLGAMEGSHARCLSFVFVLTIHPIFKPRTLAGRELRCKSVSLRKTAACLLAGTMCNMYCTCKASHPVRCGVHASVHLGTSFKGCIRPDPQDKDSVIEQKTADGA